MCSVSNHKYLELYIIVSKLKNEKMPKNAYFFNILHSTDGSLANIIFSLILMIRAGKCLNQIKLMEVSVWYVPLIWKTRR